MRIDRGALHIGHGVAGVDGPLLLRDAEDAAAAEVPPPAAEQPDELGFRRTAAELPGRRADGIEELVLLQDQGAACECELDRARRDQEPLDRAASRLLDHRALCKIDDLKAAELAPARRGLSA